MSGTLWENKDADIKVDVKVLSLKKAIDAVSVSKGGMFWLYDGKSVDVSDVRFAILLDFFREKVRLEKL